MEEDRISQLPDDILRQILFFAGTRKAVQVSILSKRWTHLWVSTPFLNFDVAEFFTATADHHHDHHHANSKLVSFIKQFEQIRHGRGSADRTRIIKLRIGRFEDESVRDFTVYNALRFYGILLTPGLTEIQVDLYCPLTLRNPMIYRMLWPNTMTRMHPQLGFHHMVLSLEFSNYHHCPHNYNLGLTEAETPESFITANVLISHCSFSCIDLQSLRGLKVLKLWHCQTLEGHCRTLEEGDIRVSAPNLVSLDCRQIRASSLSLLEDDYPFLEDAVLDITIPHNRNGGGGNDDETRNIVMNILPKLHHAKALTLTTSLLKRLNVQQNLFGHLPIFHNLKNVVVICETSNTRIRIREDLRRLWPNLEKVEIKHRCMTNRLRRCMSTIQLHPPTGNMDRILLALGYLACASTVQLLSPIGIDMGWILATLGVGCTYLYFERRNNI